MKVDISDIIRNDGASMSFELSEVPAERKLSEGCELCGELGFAGVLTNVNGILQLEGQLKASYACECYRCLAEINKDINLCIKESFASSGEAEKADMYSYEGKILDISKALYDNIILNLPMKQLCSAGCKGLCSRCGANLNEVDCRCGDDDMDPRLEGLGKFFDRK